MINVYDFTEGTENYERMERPGEGTYQVNDYERHQYSPEDIERIIKAESRVRQPQKH